MAVVARQLVVTVTTAGTRVPLLASGVKVPANVVGVIVQATNGTVYLGDVNVSSTVYAMSLVSTDKAHVELPLYGNSVDLQTIYIDGAANGAALSVLYFERVGS